jgi:lysine decarboxylase
MDQSRTPLFDAIVNFIEEGTVPLMVPGHKMGEAIHPKWKDYVGERIFRMDLCDTQDLDDLSMPHGPIKEAQELAADAWGADRTFFLVNGTSSGIVASISTVASEGGKIIVPRNAHKSVVFGLIVSGAVPVYAEAELCREEGLVGGMDPARLARLCAEHPDARGVFGVSPTYYGVCSDMKSLIDTAHAAGMLFIADEAHGNHVYFHESLPTGAIALGADFTCQSIHKMSGSFTQSSMLHVNDPHGQVNIRRLRSNLQMMQNTSPNYLLMASLDLARSHIATQGRALLADVLEWSEQARRSLKEIPGVRVLGRELIGRAAITDYEPTRIVFSMRESGLTGYEVFERLRSEHAVEIEFGDYFNAVCVLGIGTKKEHLDRLVAAVRALAESVRAENRKPLTWDEALPPMPPMALSPRAAHFAERRRIPWADARGKVSAEMIVPYPPGVPTICPGEIITDEVFEFLDQQSKSGRHLHGPENGKLETIDIVET